MSDKDLKAGDFGPQVDDTQTPQHVPGSEAPHDQKMTDEHRESSFFLQNVLTPCCSLFCCPCVVCCSWKQVNEGQEIVILRWGQYAGTKRTAGCHWINCIGSETTTVSSKLEPYNLPVAKMVDRNGNPLNVSGVLVYSVENSMRAVLNVESFRNFVQELSATTLKQVVSRFPYESHDEKEPSLKTEARTIGKELVTTLQSKVVRGGIRIHSFEFNELSYAPEIASQMLKRQQAVALVQARSKIVEGAVDTAWDAIQRLKAKGISLSEATQERLVTNLLTVMVSDENAQPTVNVG